MRQFLNKDPGIFNLLALAAAAIFPHLVGAQPVMAGNSQHVIFLVATTWHGKEVYDLQIRRR